LAGIANKMTNKCFVTTQKTGVRSNSLKEVKTADAKTGFKTKVSGQGGGQPGYV
jgi:mevalonate kinase